MITSNAPAPAIKARQGEDARLPRAASAARDATAVGEAEAHNTRSSTQTQAAARKDAEGGAAFLARDRPRAMKLDSGNGSRRGCARESLSDGSEVRFGHNADRELRHRHPAMPNES